MILLLAPVLVMTSSYPESCQSKKTNSVTHSKTYTSVDASLCNYLMLFVVSFMYIDVVRVIIQLVDV